MTALPIDAVLPAIDQQLAQRCRLVVQAAPGAGKSTRIPLHLLTADWLAGRRILLLEPRRIAARNLAAFLADSLGETVGQTVGLQVRGERRIGPATRLEVLTEGMLVRRLQGDPELAGVGAVLFDEFHERHLPTDLGLALILDVQESLREDLRIVLMSATLDVPAVSRWFDAPAVPCEGRSHPVAIEHRPPRERHATPVEVAHAVRSVLKNSNGDVLVFLPGRGEIERTRRALEGVPADVRMLHGALPLAEQRRVLGDGDGQRVVLATNIAESSLTVPGVTAVVDSGLERAPVFDPRSGLTRLATRRITRDSADQRAGRAGRLAPGVCLRLWSPGERLVAQREPEIASADLSGMALELAAWGVAASDLRWLTPPPTGALDQARSLLQLLGALDHSGKLTERGRSLQRWGTDPRFAAILEDAGDDLELAAAAVAMIEQRDPLPALGDDLRERLRAWRLGSIPGGALAVLEREAARWLRRAGSRSSRIRDINPERTGLVLARGLPDRIARARDDQGSRFQMANGRGVRLKPGSALQGSRWLVVCDARLEERDSLIYLAAPVDEVDVRGTFADRLEERHRVAWDDETGAVAVEKQTCLGAIALERRDWPEAPAEAVSDALIEGIRRRGLTCLPWTARARDLQARVGFVAHHTPESVPDWQPSTLLDTLETWLGPYLVGMSRISHLGRLNLAEILGNELGHAGRQELARLAPESLPIGSGRNARIDYGDPAKPVLAAKLQELFGKQPALAVLGGRVPLTLHLLSPAGRPLQITSDLDHFWDHAYIEVAKEMRGRYPKHPWPEDPRTAPATARTKRASQPRIEPTR